MSQYRRGTYEGNEITPGWALQAGGLQLIETRDLTPDEKWGLESFGSTVRLRRNILAASALTCLALTSIGFLLAFRATSGASGLIGFLALSASCFLIPSWYKARALYWSIKKELLAGEVHVYEYPADWMHGHGVGGDQNLDEDSPEPSSDQEFVVSTSTHRLISAKGEMLMRPIEVRPELVAELPETHFNLVASGWLAQNGPPLYRQLSDHERIELRRHIAVRHKSVVFGAVGVLAILSLTAVWMVSRKYPGGFAIVAGFSLASAFKGYRSAMENRELTRGLESAEIAMIQGLDQYERPVIYEYLVNSRTVWSIAGNPAPWRGISGS